MKVSNSEVETFNMCERAHYYKFALGLMPKQSSTAIRIGVLGHKILETYYRQGLETENRRIWYDAAIAEIELTIDRCKEDSDFELVNLVSQRFNEYVKHYRSDKQWRIVDVEGQYAQQLSGDIEYTMTLDLLVEAKSGEFRGQYIVVDHKWCYNFQTNDEVMMNAQLPKYIHTLRTLGFNVTRGVLNQIRYRTDIKEPSKLFHRRLMKPTTERINNIMREQLKASQLIRERLNLPVAQYRDEARTLINRYICKNCYFRYPCDMELDGRDSEASLTLALDYTENTYGYRG